MIIDAYAHCGLDKFLPVESVGDAMLSAGVGRAVLCQHLGQTDNSYIGACVRADPHRFIGVAMLDPTDARADAELASMAAGAEFRGIRMTVDMLIANEGFASTALTLGLNVVVYAPDGVGAAIAPISRLPYGEGMGRVVITHLGCPQFSDGALTRGADLLECAALTTAMVTLSGLGMACPYPHPEAASFVRDVVGAFGTERVMWGSNFPVLGTNAAYATDLRLLLDNVWQLPASAIPALSGLTAKAVWFS